MAIPSGGKGTGHSCRVALGNICKRFRMLVVLPKETKRSDTNETQGQDKTRKQNADDNNQFDGNDDNQVCG